MLETNSILVSTDFAIAAPYVDSGIVYIYRGGTKGLELSQRIVGSELFPGVAGFGFAISRGQDIDKNGYNGLFYFSNTRFLKLLCFLLDIAIGAYKSGHAIIIRSKPVIDLDASITWKDQTLKRDSTMLTAKICVIYHGPRAPKKIGTNIGLC